MGHFKNKRLMILVGVTLVASVLLLYDHFLSGGAPRSSTVSSSPRVPSPQPAPPPAAAVPATTARRRLAPPPLPDQPWRHDPFAIEGKWFSQLTFTDVKVSGIVWGPDGYKALINDFVVRPGDVVKGIRILRITEEGVEVEKDGRTGFIHLAKPEIMP